MTGGLIQGEMQMLARQEVGEDQRYRRGLIVVVLVGTTAVLSFGIGRTTAETTSRVPRPVIAERPIPPLGPMSRSDRTRHEVYRKLNRIGPLQPGG
jgi:hypothetical protein